MERSEAEKVVQGFLDASYARDWQAMETIFHDGFEFFGHDENGALRKSSKEEFVSGYRARASDDSWPYYPSYNEIISLDFDWRSPHSGAEDGGLGSLGGGGVQALPGSGRRALLVGNGGISGDADRSWS